MRMTAVINKWWECEPAISAMLNVNASPAGAPWPSVLKSPLPRPSGKFPAFVQPRAVFSTTPTSTPRYGASPICSTMPKVTANPVAV